MDGLKHCSTMLAELRTSALTPKNYYELYMAIFDSLRHLTTYLHDAHTSGRHHLADLYELVQYAGNIVPRLYLMITVGAVYMSITDAPIKEIMKDMMEMSRGVQHPTRGLFLRHYLSGATRDYLPVGDDPGPAGNLQDSIGFVLTNFIEMNKLWVRLQHQGHSRDRERREIERKELKILVGTNLVRLSQLEGVDLPMYQNTILPAILEQVVNCKDVIAQEYLMEVIIQVFHDDFHLRTLSPFLTATAQLHPKVNVKNIVITLIDRLAAYAAREAENESAEEREKQEEEAKLRLSQKIKEDKERRAKDMPKEEDEEEVTEKSDAKETEEPSESKDHTEESETKTNGVAETETNEKAAANGEVARFRGIPVDVKLFEVFWTQIVELVKARPDLLIQDISALLVSLTNLSLSCYPDSLEYVDQVLAYAKEKTFAFADSPDMHTTTTTSNLLSLLLAPINSYRSILTLLALPSYHPLLLLQPFSTRRSVAHAVISSVLRSETIIESPQDVHGVLDLCHVLVKDQKDAGVGGQPFRQGGVGMGRNMSSQGYDAEEMAEEQGWLARMVHLFRNENADVQLTLLQAARKQFADGGERIRYTFPPVVVSAIKLARRYKTREHLDDDWQKKCSTLFRFIHQVISILYTKVECPDVCLRLFLLAGQSADECGFEEICYEFYVQAFTIYEESISESRAQYQAITLIIGTLQTSRIFGSDNYDTLITKAALHGSKLLKKPDQCRAVCFASHLWWASEVVGRDGKEDKELYRDGKRVLECLQKALKIADSVMDTVTNLELFVEILNRYIYYFERKNDAVTVKYLNGLIDLINTNLENLDNPDQHPMSATSSSIIEDAIAAGGEGSVTAYIVQHFKNTLLFIKSRQEGDGAETERFGDINVAGPLLKLGVRV